MGNDIDISTNKYSEKLPTYSPPHPHAIPCRLPSPPKKPRRAKPYHRMKEKKVSMVKQMKARLGDTCTHQQLRGGGTPEVHNAVALAPTPPHTHTRTHTTTKSNAQTRTHTQGPAWVSRGPVR